MSSGTRLFIQNHLAFFLTLVNPAIACPLSVVRGPLLKERNLSFTLQRTTDH
jgi:hypothetical protein